METQYFEANKDCDLFKGTVLSSRTYVLLLNTNPLNNDFPMFKVHINSRPSLTISKSFYFKRYNNMSKHLKTLYESQNHVRINSRNKPIDIFK